MVHWSSKTVKTLLHSTSSSMRLFEVHKICAHLTDRNILTVCDYVKSTKHLLNAGLPARVLEDLRPSKCAA